jgi:hypothetical protein
VRCALYELHQLGCLEPIPTEAGKRWHLCGRGLHLIATASHMHIHTLAEVPDDETGRNTAALLQRGEGWLLQHSKHTAGIYDFFARLVQDARREAGQELCWLEWDRGTMNGRDSSIKLLSYAHYIVSREWARERSRLPLLVCVTPDIAQEKRMQRVSQAIYLLKKRNFPVCRVPVS